MDNDELRHWGILGMKWGDRRFQNEDGSLTPEGRERYRKNKSNGRTKVNAKQVQKKDNDEPRKMSYDEMRAKSEQYRIEADYYRNLNNSINEKSKYAELTAPPQSKLKQIAKHMWNVPITKALDKFTEFQIHSFLYAAMGGWGDDARSKKTADWYYQWVVSSTKNKNKDQDQDRDKA